MFYVIGTYENNESYILDRYETLKDAQNAVWWQSQPRMYRPEWTSKERLSGWTHDHFRGKPYSTYWQICKASNIKGIFWPIDKTESIQVLQGFYTWEAWEKMLNQQIIDWESGK